MSCLGLLKKKKTKLIIVLFGKYDIAEVSDMQ